MKMQKKNWKVNKLRNNLVKVICEAAKTNENLFFVTADLGFNVLNPFYENFPNQFINVGIAEQNMASLSAGLALEGKKVFMYSIGNFSTLRCIEQIRNDICYHNADVKIVALAAGFAYGALGMSHHATEDIACMKSLPNLTVFSPCDPIETRAVTLAAINLNTPCYIRLGRGGEENIHDDSFDERKFEIGKAYKIADGNDGCMLSTGAITIEAKKAIEVLKKKGYNVSLYSFPTIKPIDEKLIKSLCEKYKHLITIEEHQKFGGFGSEIADVMSSFESKTILHRIGLNDEFTSVVGDTNFLREQYKMDCNSIVSLFMEKCI